MNAPSKKPHHIRRFWDSLSDEELLFTELTTDDPDGLDGLVSEIPPGNDETYVEYKYDLRGTEHAEFKCVHGNHGHLAGYVMRKGSKRFKVGWICGKTIYGADFETYKADFNAAVNRREALRRAHDIKEATVPFMAWFERLIASPVFDHYDSVRDQLDMSMEGLVYILQVAAEARMTVSGVKVPPTLFNCDTNPRAEAQKLATEISSAVLLMTRMAQLKGQTGKIAGHLDSLAQRADEVISKLKEVEDFFQPLVLDALCAFVTEHDNPKKRIYEAGLLSVTCKRDKKKRATVHLPRSFRVPSRAAVDIFRKALNGLKL